MNLDDLKSTWKDYHQTQEAENPLNGSTIAHMMKGKTSNIISKIQRNMLLEMLFVFVLCSFVVPLTDLWPSEGMDVIIWQDKILLRVLVPISFLSIMYWRVYQQLNSLKTENVRAALDKITLLSEMYLAIYHDICFWIFALILSFVTFQQIYIASPELSNIELITRSLVSILGVGLTIWLNNLFIKWYIKKLYGSYLDTLRKYREEIALMEN